MTVLRIFLIGLVALVPDKSGGLTAVLQDARDSGHLPVLITECKNTVGANCRPGQMNVDHEIVDEEVLDQSNNFIGRVLEKQEISIDGSLWHDVPLELVRGRRRFFWHHLFGSVPRTPKAAHDYSWIAAMREVSKDSSKIKPECISDPSSNRIASLLQLGRVGAALSAFELVASTDGKIHSFTFKHDDKQMVVWGEKQAIADIALLSVPLRSDQAKIILSSFRHTESSGGRQSPIVLTLKASPDENFIDIVVANVPAYIDETKIIKNLLEEKREKNKLVAEEKVKLLAEKRVQLLSEKGDHFEHFYDLTSYHGSSETKIPIRGFRGVDFKEIEGPVQGFPRIIRYFQRVPESIGGGASVGSTNRPICAEVVLDQ